MKKITSILLLLLFVLLFIASGEDGICNLDGCDKSSHGCQYASGESYGFYGCTRTGVAADEGWGYCSREHCYDDR